MPDLAKLKAFDIDGASLSLWVFKKRVPKGAAPIYTGRWAEIGDDLTTEIKRVTATSIARIEEVIEYSHLAQNHETSVLTISTAETHAGLLKDKAAAQQENKRVRNSADLENIEFYAFRFVKDETVLYAIRKADQSWKTRKRRDIVSVVLQNHELVLDRTPSFNISKAVDFFVYDEAIFIAAKQNFESVLAYKAGHQDDFVEMQAEDAFKGAFVDLEEIVKFVGDNKIQLRRISAIRQKGHYKDRVFMDNLRRLYKENGLNIVFDGSGKIVPSEETCRDIFQALLDHRLGSDFSRRKYDVPDTSSVTV
ncbi:Kiwa anti-phage protein KwaB-like domain-containing protein [Hansschlegelia beijingensis]|uniref:DUF4868 domain-containing protein n=1 Tax=Hansschlegelia beijingensis TaxID=1133344 RepID=A0A7W6CZ62_9HYPH|nr:Kiwa anti-phage protein KwaB-like domain-containing protein [Hansschlegelia beijingensis]MBB3973731.1 hypothetical protein [Hansschlegelia beijingensis]